MPRLTSETLSQGDQSWLGSTHGLRNARSESLLGSAWAAVAVGGVIASGYPAALVSGLLVPYDKTEGTTTGAGVLAGHILFETSLPASTAKVSVAFFDHGRVNAAKVPLLAPPFVKPVAAAKGANVTAITYI